ncbi:hypothetical protein G5B37_06840 [Rasiella rasia]|uniref:Uncharacterized protein n=1 Tax=Rasiella rasia TaxID=2744027 RepID=A0A6G6GL61_9FLAO|nr:hypothetical protein [Rasiella rasia]QIE59288.1 hypothetical protein G5B37_06840 [Rasiella rasia]
MKASVQYGDFKGTASADISDELSSGMDNLQDIANYFGINTDRFKVVGISIYGTKDFSILLFCVDSEQNTDDKERIVKILCDCEDETNILDTLFKRFNVVLHSRHDEKYSLVDNYDEEANFEDYHEID